MKEMIGNDIKTIRLSLGLSLDDFSRLFSVNKSTMSRWESGALLPRDDIIDGIYSYAYKKGIRINQVKELLYKEKMATNQKLLFHGSKCGIQGPIGVEHSEKYKDFGAGFYLGETLTQAGMFVASYQTSKLYFFLYEKREGVKEKVFSLSLDWVISICFFRGYLEAYKDRAGVKNITSQVMDADMIIAPIADNQMFEIMKDFADGFISDEECIHSLAATNLGLQFVCKSRKALDCLTALEESFLCSEEKRDFVVTKREQGENNSEKMKIIKREFRGKGHFIDQIL